MGLLGGSVSLAAKRSFAGVKVVGYSHRSATRDKARQLGVADEIKEDIEHSVNGSDLVILATPICTFEEIFRKIRSTLKKHCVVTDLGSTKRLPEKWAACILGKEVFYVGSHPIAGSEQRGIDFARDDLFDRAVCILTQNKNTSRQALGRLVHFWRDIGCVVKIMGALEHDKVFAQVSHLPHLMAAALINSSSKKTINYAGKGFLDTTRIASGPADVWADIFYSNPGSCVKAIQRVQGQLRKFKEAITSQDKQQVRKLLGQARKRRQELIRRKVKEGQLL